MIDQPLAANYLYSVMSYTLIEVETPEHVRAFLELPRKLNKATSAYIRPLDQDVEAVFDPKKNRNYQHGEAKRWLLQGQKGETIGRVAAFFDTRNLSKKPLAVGSMGFFECIDNLEAAQTLLSKAESWLQSHGANVVEGPINFGDRDRWWGVLTDGFEIEPNYACNYNPPYYLSLLERCGYHDYFRQFTYGMPVIYELDPRLVERAKRIMAEPGYTFRHIKSNEMDRFGREFLEVYNKAWGKHAGVRQLSEASMKGMIKTMKPVMDPRIIWFAYHNDKPVGFFLMLPELNQIIKHLNGRLDWWGKVKFAFYRFVVPMRKCFGLVYGIVPEYQGKGLERAIVYATAQLIQDGRRMPYREFEMNWVGDFNPKMMRIAELVGGSIIKTHITMRKMLDPELVFERCPVIR